jgi:hypothetical protein
MSTLIPTRFPCERCGAEVYGLLADSLNANRTAWVLPGILDGSLHRFTCPGCGCRFVVDKELLYTDFERRHFIGVFPLADQPRFLECGALVEETFAEALVERAPRVLQRQAGGFTVRVVFSLAELREKLLCFHAGLDDRVLEMVKLAVMAEQWALMEGGLGGLVLEDLGHDALTFTTVWRAGATAPDVQRVWIDRAAYAQAAAAWPALERDHAALARGPYVSVMRYWGAAPPDDGAPRSSPDRRIWRSSRP